TLPLRIRGRRCERDAHRNLQVRRTAPAFHAEGGIFQSRETPHRGHRLMDGAEEVGMVALGAALAVSAIALLLLAQFSQARASRQLRVRVARVRARRAADAGRPDAMASVRKDAGGSYPVLEALARRIVPRPAL